LVSGPEAKSSRIARQKGNQAEQAAADHLEGLGMRIAARNVRGGGGELDIVAWEGETLVFVEVKGRRADQLRQAGAAVDLDKRRRLVGAAQHFLQRLGGPPPICRFDFVAVALGGKPPEVRHLRDAFRPGD
jgi:putative endonuclease